MGQENKNPTDGQTLNNSKPSIPRLFLPRRRTGSHLPVLQNTVTNPARGVNQGKIREHGASPIHNRKMTLSSLSTKTRKATSERAVHRIYDCGDTVSTTFSPNRILQKHSLSLASQSDGNNIPELSISNVRRDSLEVQAATSRRSSQQTGNKGSILGSSSGTAALQTYRCCDETPTHTEISDTEVSERTWPQWERDNSSEDVEEHFVGVIRRASMSVVLPYVHEDTGTVDVGGIEITPGLYLRRRVKHITDHEKPRGTRKATQRFDSTTSPNRLKSGARKEGSKAPEPPLYPPIKPHVPIRKRWSTLGTCLQVCNRDLLDREPAPVSVSRLVPFDTSVNKPRVRMDNMKSTRKYRFTKNIHSSSNDLPKSEDDVGDVFETVVPLSKQKQGIPFHIKERMRSKKTPFKCKNYLDNTRNYLKAMRKLQERVFLGDSLEVFPMKGL